MNRKGNAFLLLMFVFTIFILSFTFFLAYSKLSAFKGFIGKDQAELSFLYQEGERRLLYTDLSAQYSLPQALFETSRTMRFCDPYMNSPLVYSGNMCRLSKFEFQRQLTEHFNTINSNYMKSSPYELPEQSFALTISEDNKTIYGFSHSNIYIPEKKKESYMKDLKQEEARCMAMQKIPVETNAGTICAECYEPSCNMYETEKQCYLDACGQSCYWANDKCNKAYAFYSINPSFSIQTSFNFTDYINKSIEVAKAAEKCASEQDKEQCMKSKLSIKVGPCLSKEETDFFPFIESIKACSESKDESCRCPIDEAKTNIKYEKGLFSNNHNSLETSFVFGAMYNQGGQYYLKKIEQGSITKDKELKLDSFSIYPKEAFKDKGVFLVEKGVEGLKGFKDAPECRIKKKIQVCMDSGQTLFNYKTNKLEKAEYRFSVAFDS